MDFPFRGAISGTVSATGVYCCFLFEAWLKPLAGEPGFISYVGKQLNMNILCIMCMYKSTHFIPS